MKYYYSASVPSTRNTCQLFCIQTLGDSQHSVLSVLCKIATPEESRGVTFHDINWNDEAAETSHRSSHERLRSEKLSCETSHHYKLQQLLIFSGYILLLLSRHN